MCSATMQLSQQVLTKRSPPSNKFASRTSRCGGHADFLTHEQVVVVVVVVSCWSARCLKCVVCFISCFTLPEVESLQQIFQEIDNFNQTQVTFEAQNMQKLRHFSGFMLRVFRGVC